MAVMRVNPTRMELTRLKKRLKVARRGHKLLKDKRDELMKKFLELVRKNKDLRESVEEQLMKAHAYFLSVRSTISTESVEQALMLPKVDVSVTMDTMNVMSVEVPVFHYGGERSSKDEVYPYGFKDTTADLDTSIGILYDILPNLLGLAAAEKSAQLMAEEIEKTRRRVNALEYVLLPQLTETIKYITMKLEENERGNITRLMKIKDMMIEQARQEARKEAK